MNLTSATVLAAGSFPLMVPYLKYGDNTGLLYRAIGRISVIIYVKCFEKRSAAQMLVLYKRAEDISESASISKPLLWSVST